MLVYDFILFVIFSFSVLITWYYSDEIQTYFNKKLNIFQFYLISGTIGFLIIVALAIVISFTREDVATDILTLHFANSLKEEIIILLFSPLIRQLRKL